MSAGRLLLVDDEDDIREVATLGLQAVGGFEVVPASSGPAALELAAGGGFDAVLLDVMMPGLDGPATLARLRELPSMEGVPAIFLTAKVQPADRRALHELGAAGILAKPFDPMTLADEVKRILGGAA